MAAHEQPAAAPTPGGHPARRIDVEPCAARVRVELGGEVVADSTRTLLLREERYPPVHYFPREDVRMDLLVPTGHTTRCPYKGVASYWNVEAGGRAAENAVWSYERPIPGMAGIAGCLAFYREHMDGWSEEDPGPEQPLRSSARTARRRNRGMTEHGGWYETHAAEAAAHWCNRPMADLAGADLDTTRAPHRGGLMNFPALDDACQSLLRLSEDELREVLRAPVFGTRSRHFRHVRLVREPVSDKPAKVTLR